MWSLRGGMGRGGLGRDGMGGGGCKGKVVGRIESTENRAIDGRENVEVEIGKEEMQNELLKKMVN